MEGTMKVVTARRGRIDIPGGVNILISLLANTLTGVDHRVYILSTYQPNRENINGITEFTNTKRFMDLFPMSVTHFWRG